MNGLTVLKGYPLALTMALGITSAAWATPYTDSLSSSERDQFSANLRTTLQNGCSANENSVGELISSDAKSMTLIFDNFAANLTPPLSRAMATCAIEVQFNIPPGRRLALEAIDVRGYADIDRNVSATVQANYSFPDTATTELTGIGRNGPYQGDFLMQLSGQANDPRNYSPCTGPNAKKAKIITTIALDRLNNDRYAQGTLSVDSVDGSFTGGDITGIGFNRGFLQFRIKWERCLENFDPVIWCASNGQCAVTAFEDSWYKESRDMANDLKDLGHDIKESFKDDMNDLKRHTLKRYGDTSLQFAQYEKMEPKYDKLIQEIRDDAFKLANKLVDTKSVRKVRDNLIENIDTVTNMRDRKSEDTWLWFSDTTEDRIRELDKLLHSDEFRSIVNEAKNR